MLGGPASRDATSGRGPGGGSAMKIGRRGVLLVPGLIALVSVAAGAQEAPSKGVAAVLRPFVERHELAGAVTLVADRDAVLSLDAVGDADVAAGAPMKTDAVFWIASQS